MSAKKVNEKLSGVAECTIYGRDLYWNFNQMRWTKDSELEWFTAKWIGYNDANWWDNVAPFKRQQKCTGEMGTVVVLEIDFRTGRVVEVEAKGAIDEQ